MSDRRGAEATMARLLSRQRRDMRTAETRQNWPGAVTESFDDIDTASYTSIQSTAAGDYPAGGATNALTMTLDPGRWIVRGHAVQELEVTTPNTLIEVGIIIGWNDGISSDAVTARAAADYPIYYRLYQPVVAAIEFIAEAEATVTLDVFAGCEPGYSGATYHLYTVQLLAFPG